MPKGFCRMLINLARVGKKVDKSVNIWAISNLQELNCFIYYTL